MRLSKEEKIARIVHWLNHLYERAYLYNKGKKEPISAIFELNDYIGAIAVSREHLEDRTRTTIGIVLSTSFGAPLHRFEVSATHTYQHELNFCAFTSTPYKHGRELKELETGFTNQVVFETYLRQLVLTSCKRDKLLTPLVTCLEKASNFMEVQKPY